MSQPGNAKRVSLKVIGNPPEGWAPKSMPAGMKRTDCPPRSPSWPCPFVTCRFNTLLVAGSERPGRYRGSIPDAIVMRETSCVLDFCDAHDAGASAKQIGIAMSLTGRRIQQLLARIAEKLRNGGELVAAGVVEGLEAEPLIDRTEPKPDLVTRVPQPPKPIPFARVALYVKIGDRDVSLDLDGDQSANLIKLLRDARVGCLRNVSRAIREALTSEDGR